MVEVKLIRLVIDQEKKEQLVVLKAKAAKRLLPIAIGINEAAAIKLKLNEIKAPRPLTHDLICQIIDKLGFKVDKVVIDDLIEGVFYAKIHLISQKNSKIAVIDARPSDAIAIALRVNSAMFVAEKVFLNIT